MSDPFDNLNDDNFLLYAIKAYDKPNCVMSEFEEDIKRYDYLKRLFFRYKEYGDLKERLIINHIIILSNVFGPEAAVRMLFFKIEEHYYSIIKPVLIFLNIMPKIVKGINGKNIYSSEIFLDPFVVSVLREIK